jgi:UDP-N-acetyl-D-galactosamine dehydrogenase
MNELSMIFARLGISTDEVLKAAGTKWNFHQYRPGLVGGLLASRSIPITL